eukprot:Hpha_TRINITY_DN34492_c0_g1::TRINITY_DN34492_c0_g1_i1::g.96089::m.96089
MTNRIYQAKEELKGTYPDETIDIVIRRSTRCPNLRPTDLAHVLQVPGTKRTVKAKDIRKILEAAGADAEEEDEDHEEEDDKDDDVEEEDEDEDHEDEDEDPEDDGEDEGEEEEGEEGEESQEGEESVLQRAKAQLERKNTAVTAVSLAWEMNKLGKPIGVREVDQLLALEKPAAKRRRR